MDNGNHKQDINELEEQASRIFSKVSGTIKPHKEFGYDQSNKVRMERAISWLSKGAGLQGAGLQDEDPSVEFVAYWIAFEAIYSNDTFLVGSDASKKTVTALDRITSFISDLIERTVAERVSDRLRPAIEQVWTHVEGLFANPYVSPENWRHYYEGTTKAGSKRNPFAKEHNKPHRAGLKDPTQFNALTRDLFRRLYYLRNMVFHGNATYKQVGNKERSQQILDGREVLSVVVPVLAKIMLEEMENDISDSHWGKVPYPRIKESDGD